MGVSGIAAVVGAVAAVGGATAAVVGGNQQRAAARHAADLQQQAQSEQKASNVAQAAAERRQQVSDDRIKRARIEQASVNTGTEASSGELGALSSINTQTTSNIGFNLGAIQRGNNISNLNQDAANSIFEGQQAAGETGIYGSIFGGIGGGVQAFNTATRTVKPIPGTVTE